MKKLTGVIPAIPTPLTSDGQPHVKKLVSFIRILFDKGCNSVNLLGTTGEATSFERSTRIRIMEEVALAGLSGKMMVGTGAASLADAVELTKAADAMGYAGALLLPPFYYKGVAPEGIADYVLKLVDRVNFKSSKLYLYNIPQFTGIEYSPEIVERLARDITEVLAGIKDSSGKEQYSRKMAETFPGLAVFPSDEATLVRAAANNYAGCISASVNVRPDLAVSIFRSGSKQNECISQQMNTVRRLICAYALVPAVKACVAYQLNDPDWARVMPPLQSLADTDSTRLFEALGGCLKKYDA